MANECAFHRDSVPYLFHDGADVVRAAIHHTSWVAHWSACSEADVGRDAAISHERIRTYLLWKLHTCIRYDFKDLSGGWRSDVLEHI